ncbi:conserved hypothetical protein [Segniliparus rotundus DSM 44985]|uniref:Lipoprotein n=2 Tax=Segniliparus rotundus TaxID=286802 RepID=D6ZC40_SEGRD|nr:conserved hypothetical protein [Segniliparus rotundus DSM 44985]
MSQHKRHALNACNASVLIVAALTMLTGCSNSGTSSMEHADGQGPIASGGSPMNKELTRQQAQETLYAYMRRTLQAVPTIIALDNTRYGGAGGGVDTCDDRIDSENSPIHYYDSRDMQVAEKTDFADLVRKTGDVWRSWGWRVEERENSEKPNRVGTSPDGYILSIEIRPSRFAGYPPSFTGDTPCFSPRFRHDDVPVPTTITRDEP